MDTLEVVKACAFDSAFSFLYSIRQGTPAATMADQVPEDIKHDRLNRLLDTLHTISADQNSAFQDTEVTVLVEGHSKNNENRLTGRTVSGKLVNFDGPADCIGKIVTVKITNAKTFSLDGAIASRSPINSRKE